MSVAMYVIATSDIVYTAWLLFKTVLGTKQLTFLHLYPKYSLFVTNKYVFTVSSRNRNVNSLDICAQPGGTRVTIVSLRGGMGA